MEMTQTQRLPVPQQVAWDALNDTALLKQCIPGCESIEPDGDNAYQLALTAAVGPVKARFKGRMALQNIQAPESYTIQFDGQGGAAGFGKGTAQVKLTPEGDETLLTYAVHAQVGGKIAQRRAQDGRYLLRPLHRGRRWRWRERRRQQYGNGTISRRGENDRRRR